MVGWARLKRLCADYQADVQQDRQDRHQRNQIEQQRGEAEETHQRNRHPRGERVADATTHRFPARMADVHGRRERAAQHRTHDRPDAVRGEDLAQVVVVPCRRGALDVVHRLGKVVNAQRNSRGQQWCDSRQAAENVRGEPRQVQAELLEGLADLIALHVVAPAERGREPADRSAENHRREAAGNSTGKADVRGPRDQHDGETDEADPRHFPHLKRGAHRDERN